MNEYSGVMVGQLLPKTFNQMEGLVKEELSKDPAMGLASRAWGLIGSKATDAVRSRLNFDVADLLGWGWTKARELHEYKDRNKHPDSETSIVYLGEHDMKTEWHPVLTFVIGPVQGRPLRFTLELTARIHSAALSINMAHITGLGSGDCSVKALLKYGEIALHDSSELTRVALPGHHDFVAPGLKIQ